MLDKIKYWYKYQFQWGSFLMISGVALMGLVFVLAVIGETKFRNAAAKQAAEAGCVSVGLLRDFSNISVDDCDGEIKLRKIK